MSTARLKPSTTPQTCIGSHVTLFWTKLLSQCRLAVEVAATPTTGPPVPEVQPQIPATPNACLPAMDAVGAQGYKAQQGKPLSTQCPRNCPEL